MGKDYKGYELIKEITDGNIKDGTTIGVFDLSVCDIFVTNIVYKNKKLLWLEGKFDTSYLVNPNCYFRIVEEQEEIDIRKLDFLVEYKSFEDYDCRDIGIAITKINKITKTINKMVDLIQQRNDKFKNIEIRLKQLDKNIKEKQ